LPTNQDAASHDELIRSYDARIGKLECEMQQVLPMCDEVDAIRAELRKQALHLS
jgi:hypothetical protein